MEDTADHRASRTPLGSVKLGAILVRRPIDTSYVEGNMDTTPKAMV